MIRRRWLRVDWPLGIRELAHRFRENAFSEAAQTGFIVKKVREKFVEASYVERIQKTQTIVDPLGRENIVNTLEFQEIPFIASMTMAGLEIAGSSKNVRPFAARLSEICDYKLSLSTVQVEVSEWVEALAAMSRERFIVDSIQLSDLFVNDRVSARVVLQGPQDVRQAAVQIADGRGYRVEKLRISFDAKQRTSVVLTSSASVTMSGYENIEIFDDVRQSLFDVMRLGASGDAL